MSLAAAFLLGSSTPSDPMRFETDARIDDDGAHRLRHTVDDELEQLKTHADRFTPELELLYDRDRHAERAESARAIAAIGLMLVALFTMIHLVQAGPHLAWIQAVGCGLAALPLVLLHGFAARAHSAATIDLAVLGTVIAQFVAFAIHVFRDLSHVSGTGLTFASVEFAVLLGATALTGLRGTASRAVFVVGILTSLVLVVAAHPSPASAIHLLLGFVTTAAFAAIGNWRNERIARAGFLIRLRSTLELRRSEDHRVAMERLSWIDPLTGIANRRAFDIRLADGLAAAGAESRPLLLALIDVDHFKTFNDCEGHQAGDECLRRLAAVLGRRVGDGFLARYGGEEFALVLQGDDEDQLVARVGSVQDGVTELRMPHRARPDGVDHTTVSIGVAFALAGGNARDLIDRADAALYRAKSAGRDCIVVDGDEASCAARNLRRIAAEGQVRPLDASAPAFVSASAARRRRH